MLNIQVYWNENAIPYFNLNTSVLLTVTTQDHINTPLNLKTKVNVREFIYRFNLLIQWTINYVNNLKGKKNLLSEEVKLKNRLGPVHK